MPRTITTPTRRLALTLTAALLLAAWPHRAAAEAELPFEIGMGNVLDFMFRDNHADRYGHRPMEPNPALIRHDVRGEVDAPRRGALYHVREDRPDQPPRRVGFVD